MVRRLIPYVPILILIAVFSLIPAIGSARQADPSCPALVELALTQIGANCADLPRNAACYGYNRVDATFSENVPPDTFSRPADQSQIAQLRTLQTAPLDLGLGQWGIAVMNVQANVPETLPGQAVTFLLLGDTAVENAVSAPTAPATPVVVTTREISDLLTSPGPDGVVATSVAANTALQANGISSDGQFVRITFQDGVAWISRNSLQPTPQMDSLVVVTNTGASPMQSFYFRTAPGKTACNQTPSLLAIKSPENIKVDLTANGANIRLGSLIMLQIIQPGNIMKITVLEGSITLNPGTPDELIVPAGFSTTRCLDDPASLGLDGQSNDRNVGANCTWSRPVPVTEEDLQNGQIVLLALDQLELAGSIQPTPTPGPVETATPEPVQTPPPSPNEECPVGSTITHIVSRGENMFRIGLRYRTSVNAILAANGLTNPNLIFVGQVLTIPCGVDTGRPPGPPQPPPASNLGGQDGNVTGGLDCGGFRATSPLDGLRYNTTTFFWDPAPGATSYRVNIYNYDEAGGGLVGSFNVAAPATSLTVPTGIGALGYGFSFGWEVIALFNGQPICRSGPYQVPREAPPDAPNQSGNNTGPISTPVATPSGFCGDSFCDSFAGEDFYTCPADCP